MNIVIGEIKKYIHLLLIDDQEQITPNSESSNQRISINKDIHTHKRRRRWEKYFNFIKFLYNLTQRF